MFWHTSCFARSCLNIKKTLAYVAGAFFDFLSVRILKLCSMYFDFQKIKQKNRNEHFFERHFHFFGVTFCGYLR